MPQKINIFWFRRDLRLTDNAGLYHALSAGLPVLPVFIFDKNILDELDDRKDRRVNFIYDALQDLQLELNKFKSTLDVRYGKPLQIVEQLIAEYEVATVFSNHDYEPYAINRDKEINTFLAKKNISFKTFKDQVIFEKNEVIKENGEPYSVFTPYSNKWLGLLKEDDMKFYNTNKFFNFFYQQKQKLFPSLKQMSFTENDDFPKLSVDEEIIRHYHNTRNIPSLQGTSRLGVHLRFGTVSIRQLATKALELNKTFLNELIWREFFMQILFHHPQVVNKCFKPQYENIKWRNNESEFELWCNGETGYPIVDAGMKELNETGFMHNRVRMITASFLVKHLLIDWRWGEAYFAKKLLDYELAANNGNWQWVAGCGCDSAPYFRIFNPTIQTKKFDPQLKYIKKWVPDFESFSYPPKIVEHEFARERCLKVYKEALTPV